MKQIIMTCVIIVIFMFFTWLFQRHMMYFPSREKPDLKTFHAQDMQEIKLETQDGLRLYSWYKPARNQQATILYLHGNAGHIGYRMPLVRQFIESGFGVLLLEYRGYGGNEGSPDEQGLYQDGHAAMRFLKQQNISAHQIVLYGESLGSGVAMELATSYPVCALVLQSPFTSMPDLARYHYPWLLLKPWDRFESLGKIPSIHSPLLILHGQQDDIVPITQARDLFNRTQKNGTMREFEQGGHNNLWSMPLFIQEIIQFINQHC